MIYFIIALLCILVAIIGVDVRLKIDKYSGNLITLISVALLLADFYIFSVCSAIDFGKNTVYKELEEQQRIETITNKQNEIIEKYNIAPEELEVLRAK